MNLARLEASALGVAGISELGCDYEQSERMWKRVELFSWRQPIYERLVKREELFSWRQNLDAIYLYGAIYLYLALAARHFALLLALLTASHLLEHRLRNERGQIRGDRKRRNRGRSANAHICVRSARRRGLVERQERLNVIREELLILLA